MRLLEHQSRKLLSSFGLVFTEQKVIESLQEVRASVEGVGLPAVLKAQVPFGGRGKAGAVKFAETLDEVEAGAGELLGMELRGTRVGRVSIEPKLHFNQEFYVGIAWDTVEKLPLALLSPSGGVDVESSPTDRLVRRSFHPWRGLAPYEGRGMASQLGLRGKTLVRLGEVLATLSEAFLACDGVTMEINPLVIAENGASVGLDAHVEIEDDAAYRQNKRLEPLGDLTQSATGRPPTPLELEAQRIDAMDHRGVAGRLVEFDGDMALLIGGGGASLTVFDAIKLYGGRPANYCEVGGNPTEEKVAALSALLLSKPEVKRMAVIMNVVNNTRSDVMARGVLMGIERAGRNPSDTISVFRVPGSWEQEAQEIMATAGIKAQGRDVSLNEAARLAVEGNMDHVA